jgi:hypothetical protein
MAEVIEDTNKQLRSVTERPVRSNASSTPHETVSLQGDTTGKCYPRNRSWPMCPPAPGGASTLVSRYATEIQFARWPRATSLFIQ